MTIITWVLSIAVLVMNGFTIRNIFRIRESTRRIDAAVAELEAIRQQARR